MFHHFFHHRRDGASESIHHHFGRHHFSHPDGHHHFLAAGFGDAEMRSRPGGGRMGGGAGRGPGGRGGRIFGQGDLRLVVLELIAAAPRHGYDIIKAIEEQFGGQYAPSPGAIYPTLTLLEEQDFLVSASAEGSGKKLYTITAAGTQHLADNRAAVDGVMLRMRMAARAMAGEMPPEAVIQAMHTLKHALAFRRGGGWTEAEVERVSRLIAKAAEDVANGASPPAPAGPAGEAR